MRWVFRDIDVTLIDEKRTKVKGEKERRKRERVKERKKRKDRVRE